MLEYCFTACMPLVMITSGFRMRDDMLSSNNGTQPTLHHTKQSPVRITQPCDEKTNASRNKNAISITAQN